MDINPSGFLWPEEHKLVLFIIKGQGAAIAWDLSEQGNFRRDYFEPIVIPTVEHIPWVKGNIPIPPGIYDEVIRIIKEKIKTRVYERSNLSLKANFRLNPQSLNLALLKYLDRAHKLKPTYKPLLNPEGSLAECQTTSPTGSVSFKRMGSPFGSCMTFNL